MRLAEIMQEREISIPEMSEMSGLTRGAIYYLIDHNPGQIRFATLAVLCKALKLTPNELFEMPTVQEKK